MTIFMFITLCLTAIYTVPPEPSEVQEIREIYGEVKALMEDEYALYRTVIDINSTNVPFPAVGNYREEITLFWTHAEEHDTYKLLFVTISGEHAAYKDYTEILYGYSGEAVFTLYSFSYPNGTLEESRRWFCADEEIHATCCLISDDSIEYLSPPERESNFIRNPETLMEIFRMM